MTLASLRPSRSQITLAVLAGGQGNRVGGADKGLLSVDGRPLVEWAIDALRDHVADVIISANRNASTYATYGDVVVDAEPGHAGPLAGIAATLRRARTDYVLTIPVDCPRPPASLPERLYATASSGRVAVAHDGERRQPLFALYPRTLAIAGLPESVVDVSPWQWQDRLGAVEVDFADCRAQFLNLNTAADVARFTALR